MDNNALEAKWAERGFRFVSHVFDKGHQLGMGISSDAVQHACRLKLENPPTPSADEWEMCALELDDWFEDWVAKNGQ